MREAAAAAAWNRTRIEAETLKQVSQSFAAIGDKFPIVISYRSEAEAIMLRVCDGALSPFTSLAVCTSLRLILYLALVLSLHPLLSSTA